jgi:hypothetical protein
VPGSRLGSAAAVAALTVSLVAPLVVVASSAHAVYKGGSPGGRTHESSGKARSKSKSPTRHGAKFWTQEPDSPSPAETVLREGGFDGQEQAVLKAIATNPARPELGRLPASLTDKQDVIDEMFEGRSGSKATMGALVVEGTNGKYPGQQVAHKLELATSFHPELATQAKPAGRHKVTATDLDDGRSASSTGAEPTWNGPPRIGGTSCGSWRRWAPVSTTVPRSESVSHSSSSTSATGPLLTHSSSTPDAAPWLCSSPTWKLE